MRRRPPRSTRTDTLFPYTTLFRSRLEVLGAVLEVAGDVIAWADAPIDQVVGEAVGVGLQRAVGAPLRAAHERLAIPHRVGGHLPDVCEGERRRRCDHDSAHRYFTATGLVGAPVPPVTGSGFATRSIS